MSVLVEIILSTALLAVLISATVAIGRGVLRLRLARGEACGETRCFGACHSDAGQSEDPQSAGGDEPTDRSAEHATR